MGGGGKGGSSTTSTVQIPPEVLARYNAVNTRSEKVAEQPYQPYSTDPNAFVAPLTSTQQAGIQNTNAMAGAAQPYYQAATSTLNQAYQNAQPAMGAAYQNIGQAQDVGNQYANAAAQQFGQAQGQAQPYYQNATAGLNAGLGMGNAMNAMGAASVAGAQGQAQPYYQNATQGTQAALRGAQPYQAGATAAALAGGQAVNAAGLDVNQYMNPYTQNVVNATQAALGQQFGQQRSDTQAQAIRSGAFGGQRAGLQQAQLAGQQALAESQAISPLYAQNYNQALAAAQQQQGVNLGAAQANRAAQQQMSNQLSGIGQQGYTQGMGAANQMANLGQNLYNQGITSGQALSGIGQTGFGQNLAASQQNQALGQGLYNQSMGVGQAAQGLGNQQYNQGMGASTALGNLANQGFNMGNTTANSLAALGTNAQQAGLAGAQAQMAAGQTQQQTQQAGLQAMYNQFQQGQSYPFQVAQFLANIAEGTGSLSGNTTTSNTTGGGGFFSDKRLKENIQKVGKTNDGQPIYRFNYKGDKNTQIGLMAQDVEKTHPEAVGLAGGYKTVNYKEATDDAVRKADGGATSSDTYSMTGSPSSFLQDSGKGLGSSQSLPQMVTGADVANVPKTFASMFGSPGADAASVAAMRAPRVGQPSEDEKAGYSLGTLASKRDQLSSLMSSQGQGSSGLGSGPGYTGDKIKELQAFLAPYKTNDASSLPTDASLASSQGGLVSQPGTFAHGGFADARSGFYGGGDVNPALEYYTKLAAQNPGLAGILAQGGARYTPPQAIQPPKPQQTDPIGDATKMAGLATTGAKFYDWAKAPSKTSAAYDNLFVPGADNSDTVIDLNTPTDMPSAELARGGMAGRHHYAGAGYVDPYGGGGDNDLLAGILQQQSQQPQYHLMKGGEMPRQQPQQSGLGALTQAASFAEKGPKAYEWAAKQLAGKASPTAMSSTSTEAGLAGNAAAPTVEAAKDVAGAAPGLGAAADTAATAGLSGLDASAFALPDATAAGIEAGITGATEAAVPVMTAAAEIPWWEAIPFLLKDGGTVPHRRHFELDANVPVINSEDKTDPDVVIPKSPPKGQDVLTPDDAISTRRPPKAGLASSYDEDTSPRETSSPFGGLGGVKDTLTSENFLVPALAGLGAMLASPNKTLAGAIGSGLVGGTTAYTGLEKQQNEMLAKRLEMTKGMFSGPFFSEDGKTQYWRMAGNPNRLSRDQYNAAYNKFLNLPVVSRASTQAPGAETPPPSGGTTQPKNPTVDAASRALSEPAPQLAPRVNKPPVAEAGSTPSPAAAESNAQPAPTPAASAPVAAGTPPPAAAAANTAVTKAALIKQALAPGSTVFEGFPPSKDPRVLQPKIDQYNQRIDELNATIQRAQFNPEALASPESEKQIQFWQNSLTNLKAQRDDLAKTADASVDSVISIPYAAAVKDAETRADMQAKLDFIGPTKAAELKADLERRHITDPMDIKKETELAVAKAQGLLPTKYDEIAFTKNIDRQASAQEKAFQMATQGQQLVNQAHAYMKAVTDENGKIVVSGGPLGSKLATASQSLQQMGFSPKFAQELTGTDPNAAGASKKLQASFASEMARLDLEKSPAVREFATYMNTSPGVDLPEKTLVWLMNNVIVPKAESMKKGYLAVASLKPEKDNIERALFDYNETNPWFSQETAPTIAGGRAQGAQTTQPARRDVPAGTPPNLIEQELRKRAAQGRQ
jgi:hypothetical protein